MDDNTTKNIKTAIELDHKHDCDLTRLEKLAGKISEFAGSISFIVWHLAIFSGWIGFNTLAKGLAFDPYPFTFLMLVVSLEAIMLSGLVLISQNKTSKQQDRRHQLDLQINLLSEQENTAMSIVIHRIAEKLKVDPSELSVFINDTKPEEVFEALESEDTTKP